LQERFAEASLAHITRRQLPPSAPADRRWFEGAKAVPGWPPGRCRASAPLTLRLLPPSRFSFFPCRQPDTKPVLSIFSTSPRPARAAARRRAFANSRMGRRCHEASDERNHH
jgi:hypothetical protein